MKKVLFRMSAILVLTAMLIGMILPMTVFAAGGSEEITNSLGAYPYPHPLQGDRLLYCGWNQVANTPNSVWYNASETSFYNVKEATNGYTDANGVHHPYGVGMHSSIKYTPSTVYSIDSFKMTSFKTTVFLVQYDMDDEEGMINITPAEEDLVPIVVYLDFGKTVGSTIVWTQPDEATGEVTYPVEKSLLKKDAAGEDNSVVLEADATDLEGYTHIRIGIKTRHGIYSAGFDGSYTSDWHDFYLIGNTAMASVYFADLEITQSEEVPLITVPSIPERPNTSPAQSDAYEDLLAPGCNEENWYSKPYGAWMAGDNTKYYLSNMVYLESSNTPNTTYPQGQPTTVNYPYSMSAGTPFYFGAEGMEYWIENGIGMHPKKPTQPVLERTDSWTVYDISMFTSAGIDTFYALVGLTAEANAWGSKLSSAGVYVYIYGDKVGDGQHYELLAESDLILGYYIGEFNVNVEDVKLLLIDVILPSSASDHAYSAVGLGNACLFEADENAVKPDYSSDYDLSGDWDDTGCSGGSHVYSYDFYVPYTSTVHYTVCDCGEEAMLEPHTWDSGVVSPGGNSIVYTCYDCFYEITEAYVPHQHSYGNWQKYTSTKHRKVCACGEDPIYENHTFDEGVTVSEATCTQPELKKYTCTECGYSTTSSFGSVAHVQGDWEQHNDLQHKKSCSCGESSSYADHAFDEGVITTAPTCTQTGVKTYTCAECGYQKTETVEKNAHAWMEWVVESDTQHKHRCSCGETEKLDHVYDDEKDLFCNDCGYQKTVATDEPVKDQTTTDEPKKDKKDLKSMVGCDSAVSLGAGVILLLSIGSAGLMFKKKED